MTRKKALIAFFIFAALAGAVSLWSIGQAQDRRVSSLPVEEVVIQTAGGDRHSFQVEVAEKPVDLQVGLMYREAMGADEGMIFLMGRDHPRPTSFWMKNTLIPLDLLFVDEKGIIVHLHEMAKPHDLTSIPSRYPVAAVIEINGGESAKRGIATGDRVLYHYFETGDK